MDIGKIIFTIELLVFVSFYLWQNNSFKKHLLFPIISSYVVAILLIIFFWLYPIGITIRICGVNFSFSYFIYPIVIIGWLIALDHILLKEKIAYFISFFLIFLVSEILVKMFFIVLCNVALEEVIDYTSYYYFSDYLLLLIGIMNVLFISIYYLLTGLSKKKSGTKIVVMVISLAVLFVIIFTISCYFSIKYIFSNANVFIYYTIFLLLVIVLVVVSSIILYKTIKEHLMMQKTMNELKSNQLKSFYNETMLISSEELIKLRHDMANLLEVLKEYNQEATKNLIENFQTIPKIYHYQNELINEILTIKHKKFVEYQIDIETNVNYPKENLIETTDMIELLTNLIDNAIEASKNALEKKISLTIFYQDNKIIINVVNSFNEDYSDGVTKKDHKYHGYGKRIVKDIVNKYDGFYEEIKSLNFIVNITIPISKKI